MRILLLSWFFPPNNTVAALRVGKLARYLHQRGHDVRVVTSHKPSGDRSLRGEIPQERIFETNWFNIDEKFRRLSAPWRRRRGDAANPSPAPATPAVTHGGVTIRRRLATLYGHVVHFPDRYVGWTPYLVRGGEKALTDWRPDLIYASAPPHSVFLAANILKRRHGIPLIAEFRDRWMDDPYDAPPPWRRWLETRLENRLIGAADAIVTVSRPWADAYVEKYGKPTALVYNGFDPEDFAEPAEPVPPRPGPVRILHMGTIYHGKRDPTPLFHALAASGLSTEDVQVDFVGHQIGGMGALAERCGVGQFVELNAPVPYQQSIERQRQSDILLLLQWNDPRELGNLPAKLFEYFAVRRPILGIGLENGVPAALIRERQAGLFCNDPDKIATQLRLWVREKQRNGQVAALPAAVRAGFSRDEQYAKLERFLSDQLAASD